MRTQVRPMSLLRSVLAVIVGVSSPGMVTAASISINNDVGVNSITDGSSIPVDGWVAQAQTMDPRNPENVLAVHVNKVKVYVMYQQQHTTPTSPGSQRYILDHAIADFSLGSSPDAPYSASVSANMPDQGNTPVSPGCWFLLSEALLDTPGSPNSLVAYVEKTIDLVWTSGGGS